MNRKSYGYCINLNELDRKEIEHLIQFNNKIDFEYYLLNEEWIDKELIRLGYIKEEVNNEEVEIETLYRKDNMQLFFYRPN